MNIIKKIANEQKTSEKEIRHEMKLAISAAKSNPASKEMWNNLFPDGRTPSPEEFVVAIVNFIKNNKSFS